MLKRIYIIHVAHIKTVPNKGFITTQNTLSMTYGQRVI